jgi:hypothetical protein
MLSEDHGVASRVVEWKGRSVVCPTNLRLRVLESTVAFASAFRGMGAGLVPDEAARAADVELRTYHRANPSHRSHVLTSAWHVPVRWFALFDPAEKEVYETLGRPALRFRTGIVDARQRLVIAQSVLEVLGVFQAPAEELATLQGWLEPFDDGSMIELDYNDVAELFTPDEILFDDSCELVHQSLQALATGDMMRAGECYGRVIARWAPAFSVTFSS